MIAQAYNPINITSTKFAQGQSDYDLSNKKKMVCIVGSSENGDPTKLQTATPIDFKEVMGSGIACDVALKHFGVEAGNKSKHEKVITISPEKNEAALADTDIAVKWVSQDGDAVATMAGTSIGDYVYRLEFTNDADMGSANCTVYKKNTGEADTAFVNLGNFQIPAGGTLAMPDAAGLVATFTDGGSTPTDFAQGDIVEFTTQGPSSQVADFLDLLDSKTFQKACENFRHVVFCNRTGFNFAFIEEIDDFALMLSEKLDRKVIFYIPVEQRDPADDFKEVYNETLKTNIKQFIEKSKSGAVTFAPQWSEDGYNLSYEAAAKKALISIAESPAESEYSATKYITKYDPNQTTSTRLKDGEYWMDVENEYAYQEGALPYLLLATEQYGKLRIHTPYLAINVPGVNSPDQRRTLPDTVVAYEVLDWFAYYYWKYHFNKLIKSNYDDIRLILDDVANRTKSNSTFRGQIISLNAYPVDSQGVYPEDESIENDDDKIDARTKIANEHSQYGTIRCIIEIDAYSTNEKLYGLVKFRKNEEVA